MKTKVMSSLILSALLLSGCNSEETQPVDTTNANQEKNSQSEAVHFEFKEQSESNFQVDRDEPEGLTPALVEDITNNVDELEELTQQSDSSQLQTELDSQTEMNGNIGLDMNSQTQEDLTNESNSGIGFPEDEENVVNEYPPSDIEYDVLPINYVNNETKMWVEERKKEQGGYIKQDGDKILLLVTAGERSHTGCSLKVNGIYEKENNLEFHFALEEKSEANLQILTYPTLLVSIPKTEKEIRFYGDL